MPNLETPCLVDKVAEYYTITSSQGDLPWHEVLVTQILLCHFDDLFTQHIVLCVAF